MATESGYVNTFDIPPILERYYLREERMLAHQRRLGVVDFKYRVVVNDADIPDPTFEPNSYPLNVPIVWHVHKEQLVVNIRNAGVNLSDQSQVAPYMDKALRRKLDQIAARRLVEGLWEMPAYTIALFASFFPDYIAQGTFLNNGMADNVLAMVIASQLIARIRLHDMSRENPDARFAERSMLLPIGPNFEGIALSLLDRRRLITY